MLSEGKGRQKIHTSNKFCNFLHILFAWRCGRIGTIFYEYAEICHGRYMCRRRTQPTKRAAVAAMAAMIVEMSKMTFHGNGLRSCGFISM